MCDDHVVKLIKRTVECVNQVHDEPEKVEKIGSLASAFISLADWANSAIVLGGEIELTDTQAVAEVLHSARREAERHGKASQLFPLKEAEADFLKTAGLIQRHKPRQTHGHEALDKLRSIFPDIPRLKTS